MANFDHFIESLKEDFGETEKGKPFSVFCKWFLENDPEWSKTVDKVWLWDDYPNKWQTEYAVTDLVFRDKENQIWAVQAKCYDEDKSTTKSDMKSFLNDTSCKEVTRRLWMQTTDKIETKAEKSFQGQDKPITVFKLNNFRDAPIDYPVSYYELYQFKIKTKPTPDNHQLEAIAAVKSRLQAIDRGQMIMPCGTGKTFISLWIKEALEAHTTLVLVPSLSLLSQTMREWAWACNTDFEILNVCSDKSVGNNTEDMDPADAPFRVTSEPDEIAKFLMKPEQKVIFCTYQSSPLIAEVQSEPSIPFFDLTIADEAHRCAGKSDASFATVLDSEAIRSNKRIFTTATPKYFGNTIKDASKVRHLAVIGMDNEAVFGPVVHQLTFGDAIQRGLLSDYQVVIVGVNQPMVKVWIDEQEIVAISPDKRTDARTLGAKIGLIKAIKDYDLKRVISFHSRVKRAKEFSKELVDVVDLIIPAERPNGKVLSDYVSGDMKADVRKKKIDNLKELVGYDIGVLTNARCLAEGVDVPSLDGVAFIDPKGSQIEIIQAVGRAIRKVRGANVQTKGTIVIPVFIEDDEDVEKSIQESNFNPVWEVLKALRAHDEVLAVELDKYRMNMAKNPSQILENISDKIIFDLPSTVDTEFSSALRTVLVEGSTSSWEFGFGLLKQFKERTGHCKVPVSFSSNGFSLGRWLSNQRSNRNIMARERYAKLSDIGVEWNILNATWLDRYSELLIFEKEFGHPNVPDHSDSANPKLGTWCGSQRQLYKNAALSQERINKLNLISGWTWSRMDTYWEDGYSNLLIYIEKEGHSSVPQKYISELNGFKLGSWVSDRRRSCTEEQRRILDNTVGWVWNVKEEQFDRGLSEFLNYIEDFGNGRVPSNYVTKTGFTLGCWVNERRKSKKSNKLSEEKFKRLSDIEQWIWDPYQQMFDDALEKLLIYKEREGDCRVPKNHQEDGFNLGQWVQRKRGTKQKLSLINKQKLDDVGFIWSPSKGKP